MLSLKVTGRLEELLVDLGSTVREGQALARLTPTDFELRLRQSEAALQQARARLGLEPVGDDDEIDIEKTALVRQAQAVARRGAAAARANLPRLCSAASRLAPTSKPPTRSSRLRKGAIRMRSRRCATGRPYSRSASPSSRWRASSWTTPRCVRRSTASIRERHAFAGEYRSAGTPIFTVVRQHPLRLQLAVPERAAADVRLGQAVRVTVEGDPDGLRRPRRPAEPGDYRGQSHAADRGGGSQPGRTAAAGHIRAKPKSSSTRPRPSSSRSRRSSSLPASRSSCSSRTARLHEQRIRTGQRVGDQIEIVDGLTSGESGHRSPAGWPTARRFASRE